MRGKDILSVAEGADPTYNEDEDGYKFTILSYGNGPGNRLSPKKENVTDETFSKYTSVKHTNRRQVEYYMCI